MQLTLTLVWGTPICKVGFQDRDALLHLERVFLMEKEKNPYLKVKPKGSKKSKVNPLTKTLIYPQKKKTKKQKKKNLFRWKIFADRPPLLLMASGLLYKRCQKESRHGIPKALKCSIFFFHRTVSCHQSSCLKCSIFLYP